MGEYDEGRNIRNYKLDIYLRSLLREEWKSKWEIGRGQLWVGWKKRVGKKREKWVGKHKHWGERRIDDEEHVINLLRQTASAHVSGSHAASSLHVSCRTDVTNHRSFNPFLMNHFFLLTLFYLCANVDESTIYQLSFLRARFPSWYLIQPFHILFCNLQTLQQVCVGLAFDYKLWISIYLFKSTQTILLDIEIFFVCLFNN